MKEVFSDKTKYIKIASIIAILGNSLLAVIKIVTGLGSKSSALLADGLDSSSDVLISIVGLIIVAIICKPADKEHPWGHRRAETIAAAFLSFAIFFMGAQLIVNAITTLVKGEVNSTPTNAAMIVSAISIIGKLILALSQFSLGKRADSLMIKANAKNMAGDVLVSIGVMVGLIVSRFTSTAYADIVISAGIGVWIIKTAISIFRETNNELMDGSASIKPYRIIKEAVDSVEGATNPHRARMRKIAGFWDISFDINVSAELSVGEAHSIASKVEEEIKNRLENVFDIMVHIEPSGDNAVEAFGLSEIDMH